jgi:hypothetical protein
MASQELTVFQISAEGGGISITRIQNHKEIKFLYHHNEFDATDGDLGISKNGEYDNFEQPFQLINSKYEWYQLHLEKVHKDYRDYVLNELIKKLNENNASTTDLHYSKERIEEVLNVILRFGKAPLRNGFQKIIVENLIKFTEYEHDEMKENYDAPSNKSKFVPKAKYEVWLAGEQTYRHDQVKMSSEIVDSFETTGHLEVNGNTIIIRDEFGHIDYAFSSDKFFVHTKSVLSHFEEWYFFNK